LERVHHVQQIGDTQLRGSCGVVGTGAEVEDPRAAPVALAAERRGGVHGRPFAGLCRAMRGLGETPDMRAYPGI
jgi:hypothetical protein